jgi:hypothetical protein
MYSQILHRPCQPKHAIPYFMAGAEPGGFLDLRYTLPTAVDGGIVSTLTTEQLSKK